MSDILPVQLASIGLSLVTSGAIISMSLFEIPNIQERPVEFSLPYLRWLFSRGSHTMPQAAATVASGFTYLAYRSLPAGSESVGNLLTTFGTFATKDMYLASGALCLGIAPVTTFIMLPNNLALRSLNDDKGADRAAKEEGQKKVNEMLEKFKWQNYGRGFLMLAGGLLGLYTALT